MWRIAGVTGDKPRPRVEPTDPTVNPIASQRGGATASLAAEAWGPAEAGRSRKVAVSTTMRMAVGVNEAGRRMPHYLVGSAVDLGHSRSFEHALALRLGFAAGLIAPAGKGRR